MNHYQEKVHRLRQMMEEYTKENVVVALSGGVDSALLLTLACEGAKQNGTLVYSITAVTKLHPVGDLAVAREVASEAGAIHQEVVIDELKDAGIKDNPKDRCYRCKKEIFSRIQHQASTEGISLVLEGTNEDDLHVYRPGIQALKELGIISPLALCHMTKEEIRRLAKEYHIRVASRPSMPCLATRLPYGTPISYEQLARIDQGEQYLREQGYGNVRLRLHGEVVRIEVDVQDIPRMVEERDELIREMKRLNFRYVTLDLEGFRSGSMDEQTEKKGGIS